MLPLLRNGRREHTWPPFLHNIPVDISLPSLLLFFSRVFLQRKHPTFLLLLTLFVSRLPGAVLPLFLLPCFLLTCLLFALFFFVLFLIRLILTTIAHPPRNQRFSSTSVSWLLDTRKGTIENGNIHIFSCAQRPIDRWRRGGCRGTPPYLRRYDRELVLKPTISLKQKLGGGGYSSKTHYPVYYLSSTCYFLVSYYPFQANVSLLVYSVSCDSAHYEPVRYRPTLLCFH